MVNCPLCGQAFLQVRPPLARHFQLVHMGADGFRCRCGTVVHDIDEALEHLKLAYGVYERYRGSHKEAPNVRCVAVPVPVGGGPREAHDGVPEGDWDFDMPDAASPASAMAELLQHDSLSMSSADAPDDDANSDVNMLGHEASNFDFASGAEEPVSPDTESDTSSDYAVPIVLHELDSDEDDHYPLVLGEGGVHFVDVQNDEIDNAALAAVIEEEIAGAALAAEPEPMAADANVVAPAGPMLPPLQENVVWAVPSPSLPALTPAEVKEFFDSPIYHDNTIRERDVLVFAQKIAGLSGSERSVFRLLLIILKGAVTDALFNDILALDIIQRVPSMPWSAKGLRERAQRFAFLLLRPIFLAPKSLIPYVSIARIIQMWAFQPKTADLFEEHCSYLKIRAYLNAERLKREPPDPNAGPDAVPPVVPPPIPDDYVYKCAQDGSEYIRVFEVLEGQILQRHPAIDLQDVYVVSIQQWNDSAGVYKKSERQNPTVLALTCVEFPLADRCLDKGTVFPMSVLSKQEIERHTLEIWWTTVRHDLMNGIRGIQVYHPQKQRMVYVFYALHSMVCDILARRATAGFQTYGIVMRCACMLCDLPVVDYPQQMEHAAMHPNEPIRTYTDEEYMANFNALPNRPGVKEVSPNAALIRDESGMEYRSGVHRFPIFKALHQMPLELLHLEPLGRVIHLFKLLNAGLKCARFWEEWRICIRDYFFALPGLNLKNIKMKSKNAQFPYLTGNERLHILLSLRGYVETLFHRVFKQFAAVYRLYVKVILVHAAFVELARRRRITFEQVKLGQLLACYSSALLMRLRGQDATPAKYHEVLHFLFTVLRMGPLPEVAAFTFESMFRGWKRYSRCSNHVNMPKAVFFRFLLIRALEMICFPNDVPRAHSDTAVSAASWADVDDDRLEELRNRFQWPADAQAAAFTSVSVRHMTLSTMNFVLVRYAHAGPAPFEGILYINEILAPAKLDGAVRPANGDSWRFILRGALFARVPGEWMHGLVPDVPTLDELQLVDPHVLIAAADVLTVLCVQRIAPGRFRIVSELW